MRAGSRQGAPNQEGDETASLDFSEGGGTVQMPQRASYMEPQFEVLVSTVRDATD